MGKLLCFTLILLLGAILFNDLGLASPLSREKRATPEQFLNSHVISQKTYDNLMSTKTRPAGGIPDYGARFDNLLKNRAANDKKLMKGVTRKPGDNLTERKQQTLIVGKRHEITNSILQGEKLINSGRMGNLWESNKAFPLVDVRRDQTEKAKVEKEKTVVRRFAAGVQKGSKLPIHYQAKYTPNASVGQITTPLKAMSLGGGRHDGSRRGSSKRA